jgi:hypothetical protein
MLCLEQLLYKREKGDVSQARAVVYACMLRESSILVIIQLQEASREFAT